MTKSSRVAFVDESRRSNRYLLACALVEVRSAVIGQHQREHEVRSQLLGALVPQLQTLMVGRLVIESRDGRDDDDKIAIHRARRPSPPLPFEHQTPADEPFALAAGCVRLGRRTRARVGEAATEDPQTLKSAEPGTPVEGGSPGPLPAGLAHRHLQYAEQQPKVNVRGSTSSATATWPRTRRHSSGAEYRLVYDVTSGATRTVGGDIDRLEELQFLKHRLSAVRCQRFRRADHLGIIPQHAIGGRERFGGISSPSG